MNLDRYGQETEVDITDKVKKLLGEQVRYAAFRGITENRNKAQEQLIVETQKSIVLNPDWDGEIYII